jgi:hypothetical protein
MVMSQKLATILTKANIKDLTNTKNRFNLEGTETSLQLIPRVECSLPPSSSQSFEVVKSRSLQEDVWRVTDEDMDLPLTTTIDEEGKCVAINGV